MLTKDLLKEFLFELQMKNYSKRTNETYNYNIGQFIAYLKKEYEVDQIEDISSIHLKKFIQYQVGNGNKSNLYKIRLSTCAGRF
ncbi:phage integrase N-terminal SAM-like domain-containing protein [Niallia sp. NCCP-28]|uniref:phage integrase N-terminal SAM-like domain-containing protein n=1 Tax=Niallia sp. NCCP-28 TaxID=2934712 RepID=UPI00208BDDA3|nr:phage integrase N-terminal SAM-like domain-containing protein [Niallia sp. NCCP-28]GKU83309.1 hypothetical protein NCCP28_27050 [Niallia sp. NCCP-28]